MKKLDNLSKRSILESEDLRRKWDCLCLACCLTLWSRLGYRADWCVSCLLHGWLRPDHPTGGFLVCQPRAGIRDPVLGGVGVSSLVGGGTQVLNSYQLPNGHAERRR